MLKARLTFFVSMLYVVKAYLRALFKEKYADDSFSDLLLADQSFLFSGLPKFLYMSSVLLTCLAQCVTSQKAEILTQNLIYKNHESLKVTCRTVSSPSFIPSVSTLLSMYYQLGAAFAVSGLQTVFRTLMLSSLFSSFLCSLSRCVWSLQVSITMLISRKLGRMATQ